MAQVGSGAGSRNCGCPRAERLWRVLRLVYGERFVSDECFGGNERVDLEWHVDRRKGDGLAREVEAAHLLKVASSNDPPILYAGKDGKLTVLSTTCFVRSSTKRASLNVAIQPVYVPFSSVIPALNSGRVDAISDTMAITAAREKQMGFTVPVFNNQEDVVVAKGNPLGIHSYSDVRGHTCGTYLGTIWVTWCKDVGASSSQVYPTETALVEAVGAKRIDAAFIDVISAGYLVRTNPNVDAELANPYKPRYAGAVNYVSMGGTRKDAASKSLLALLDRGFLALHKDGQLNAIVKKWGYSPSVLELPLSAYKNEG